jgi:hypothetical protein
MTKAAKTSEINRSYVLNAIRKYNKQRHTKMRQTYLDATLSAVGIHVKLLPKSRAIAPALALEERQRVVYFLNQFLKVEQIALEIPMPE